MTQQTTQTTTSFLFPNLFSAIKAEQAERTNKFISDLNDYCKCNPVEKVLSMWYYNELLPTSKKHKKDWQLDELKAYLIERRGKQDAKNIENQLSRLKTVSNAPDLISIVFNVEWKKSRMWGSTPRCEAKERTSDMYNYYDSGSIGGCGYDKESTAIANAANQSNSFLKALYLIKEQHPTVKNHELFGYGSGYGILPSLEGGVGVSCYPKIFEKIGFAWSNVGSGKSFDVYVAALK